MDALQELYNKQADISRQIREEERRRKDLIKRAEDLVYQPRVEESIFCRSDYAGFDIAGYSFYYGYEFLAPHPLLKDEKDDDDKNTWAFTVFKDNKEIYKRAILPKHIDFDCLKGLLAGFGYWIADKQEVKE